MHSFQATAIERLSLEHGRIRRKLPFITRFFYLLQLNSILSTASLVAYSFGGTSVKKKGIFPTKITLF